MRNFSIAGLIFRTQLEFHASWYIAFAVIIAIIVTRFPEYYSFTERLLLGVSASALFLLSVIGRQFAIILISHLQHIPLKGVMLYPFGGIPRIAKEENLPILEVLLAVVGLLSSLIVVFIFYAVYVALVVSGNVLFAWLIQWLVYINLVLFVVHFIPGFPLEGGTILRAVLWKITRSYNRATLITIRIGQIAGAAFFAGGAALLFNRQWFPGVLMVFFGWILYIAATRGNQNAALTRSLQGITVQQIMSRDFSIIPCQLTLSNLVKDFVLTTGRFQFVVFAEDKLQGIVNIDEMKSVPRKKWETTLVSQIMIPSSQQTTAYVDQPASDLLDRMNLHKISYIPVLDGNRVVGLASREAMVHFNKTRAKLKI
jgi:Zn-dependent protease